MNDDDDNDDDYSKRCLLRERANFALLVLPRGSAGWSASSLVPASPPCPGGCLGIVFRRRNFPRAFF